MQTKVNLVGRVLHQSKRQRGLQRRRPKGRVRVRLWKICVVWDLFYTGRGGEKGGGVGKKGMPYEKSTREGVGVRIKKEKKAKVKILPTGFEIHGRKQ